MAEFKELVEKYKKRSKDQLIDTVSLGLTCAESDVDDAELNKPTFRPDIKIRSDVGAFLEALHAALPSLPSRRK